MFGKRFKNELELVSAALADESKERLLREYLSPYMDHNVEVFTSEYGDHGCSKTELKSAGWAHLGMAMRKYITNAELMKERRNTLYYFSTYFAWYARQAMLEYVNSKKG